MRFLQVLQIINAVFFLIFIGFLIGNMNKNKETTNEINAFNGNQHNYKGNIMESLIENEKANGKHNLFMILRRIFTYLSVSIVFFGLGAVYKMGSMFKMQTL